MPIPDDIAKEATDNAYEQGQADGRAEVVRVVEAQCRHMIAVPHPYRADREGCVQDIRMALDPFRS